MMAMKCDSNRSAQRFEMMSCDTYVTANMHVINCLGQTARAIGPCVPGTYMGG